MPDINELKVKVYDLSITAQLHQQAIQKIQKEVDEINQQIFQLQQQTAAQEP